MKKKVFIGIDVSKSKLDVTYCIGDNLQAYSHFIVSNNPKGFIQILKRLNKLEGDHDLWLVCFEDTGLYSIGLALFFQEQGIDFCQESALRIKLSMGIKRGKNDKLDSREIAQYAYTHKEKLRLTDMPKERLLELKVLLSYRDRLLKQKNALLVAARESYECFGNETTQFILEDSQEIIAQYNQKLKDIERRIKEYIQDDEELRQNYDLATSVVGVGPIIIAYMLVQTNNFRLYNPREYACHTGVAPHEHSSGTDLPLRRTTSKMANKKMKTLLTNGANSAIMYDPQLKLYHSRKVKEGKNKYSVLNAVRFKLIARVFSVVKRGTPYVKMAH
jgi:transposase